MRLLPCLPSSNERERAGAAGAFRYGSVAPRVVPFQVSLTEAQRAFERWQQAHWLAPARVLRRGQTEMRALLLPFWLFEAAFQVEYTGVSCLKAAKYLSIAG